MHGEAGHLHQVTECGFAIIALPVGVSGEADRGIEGQVGRHRSGPGRRVRRAKPHRVERQQALQPLQQIQDQETEQTERKHASRVLCPALIGGFLNAGDRITQPLQRAEHGVQKGPLTREHARHIQAEGFRHREDQQKENENLQESRCCHSGTSEALRLQQFKNQIAE